MLNRNLFGKQDATANDKKIKESGAYPYAPNSSARAQQATAPVSDAGKSASDAAAPAPSAQSSGDPAGSKLIVGPNITLKGVEITNCDTLVVEGHVEATMDSRMIQIAQPGTFSGRVGIDVAEISGTFSGELTARKRLLVRSTGKVSGKVHYGKLIIEEGGELAGEVTALSPSPGTAGGVAPRTAGVKAT